MKAGKAIGELQKLLESPELDFLGGKDCRVVNQQTFEAYRLLKSFGREVE